MSLFRPRTSISTTFRSCFAAKYSVSSQSTRKSSPDSENLLESDETPPSPPADGYAAPSNPLKSTGHSSVEKYAEGLPKYRLHVHSSRNNTIATFTRPTGHPIAWFSGGSCGFKKGNRSSYEAAYQCAVRMFKRITKQVETDGPMQLDLFFKGFGQGREALQRAMLTSEGELVRPMVVSVTDRTPIKIGGTRAKKMRRLWCVLCSAHLPNPTHQRRSTDILHNEVTIQFVRWSSLLT